MKKNRGNPSKIKISKEAKIQPTRWCDSSANSKWLCLSCFKCFKSSGVCCGWDLTYVHKDARPPKKNASKNKWRQFFSLFLNGYNADKKQLKKIISLRKEYKLSTQSLEIRLKQLEKKHEEQFGLLDLKRHEAISINVYDSSIQSHKYITDKIYDLITTIKKNQIQPKHNEIQYLVVFTGNANSFIIPKEKNMFDIYKVRCDYSHCNNNNYTWNVRLEDNSIEKLRAHSNLFHNQFSYSLDYLVFPTKIQAMNFRQEILTLLYPLLKELNIPYLKSIHNIINIDFDRVMKKSPELLI